MKNIARYLSIFLVILFLVGCSSKEMTKTYFVDASASGKYVENKIYYKENSDLVLKLETILTAKDFKNRSAEYKEKLMKNFEKQKESFKDIEGVEFSYEENGNDMIYLVKYDYTKIDLEKMKQGNLLYYDLLSEDKKTASLMRLENSLKQAGWQEKN